MILADQDIRREFFTFHMDLIYILGQHRSGHLCDWRLNHVIHELLEQQVVPILLVVFLVLQNIDWVQKCVKKVILLLFRYVVLVNL